MLCASEISERDERNRNEFGWWINEMEDVISSSFTKREGFLDSDSFSIYEEQGNLNLSEDSSFCPILERDTSENKNKGKFEEMGLTVNVDKTKDGKKNLIENGLRKSPGFSYTPERLVKSEEYKILSPPFQSACIHSCKFRQRKLSQLIDTNKVGGIHLQRLLCPSLIEIKDSYLHLKECIDSNKVIHEIKEGSFTSVISNFKKLKMLSNERVNRNFSSSEEEDTSGIQSTGWSLDSSTDPIKVISRLENQKASWNEDGLIFDYLEVDSDSENLSEIQSKVKRLQDVNQDIQKDIETLKEDFKNDEWKVNVLLEEAINFRRDIQELKYLDDLLNLLRGELEKLPLKTWPFTRNHIEHTEEINLII